MMEGREVVCYFEDSIIFQLPLAFVRSGDTVVSDGRSYVIGSNSYGWSRVSQSATFAYFLIVYPADITPSSGYDRWFGFPLRFTIVQLPLAFVRSGFMHLSSGNFYNVGNVGASWSCVSYSSTNTYVLGMNPTVVAPSDHDSYRWHGRPLRCLCNGNV